MNLPFETYIKYPAVFLAGLAVACLVTPLWRRLAPAMGMLDRPGGRKMHRKPVPAGGGVALFLGFHAACAVEFLLPWKPFSGQIDAGWWVRFLPLSAGVLLLGLLDDRFGMKPAIKLAGQVLLALAACALDIRIGVLTGFEAPAWAGVLLTVFWFLAAMNAFNLIDGLDGLAAGIALIAAAGIGVSLIFRGSPGDVLLFAGFAGACLGFLRYNFYPASVFLGDTGSLFIGFTLAALTISTSSKGTAVAAIGVPLLAVGVPLFDSALAVWRRTVRRLLRRTAGDGSPVRIDQGDADHLHHRLLRQGRQHDQVAWILYAITAALVLVGILTTVFNNHVLGILGIAFVVTVYVVFRHLAWIELRDTGEVILRGIARPVRRNLSLLFYILADLAILNLVWLVAVILVDLHECAVPLSLKDLWLKTAVPDVAVPFLVLVGFRAYSRVWSLATVTEYFMVGVAVLLGGMGAFGLALLRAAADSIPAGMVLHYMVFAMLSAVFVVGIRAFLRLVPELMSRRCGSAGSRPERALVFGDGPAVMLYLRYRTMLRCQENPPDVAGVVSGDDALGGHFISGIRVLGHEQDLPALIRRQNVGLLVAVGTIDAPQLERLKAAARGCGIRMHRWTAAESQINLDLSDE